MKQRTKTLRIDDDSDCETCTARNAADLELLLRVKCDVRHFQECPECGRIYSAFVPAEKPEVSGG